ncbi:hypothetical protein STRDD11_00836 [Streptococcus sp. DD11]|nr:hypothetical protein STRDD11_00836 [Streptococcus sp. DD11]
MPKFHLFLKILAEKCKGLKRKSDRFGNEGGIPSQIFRTVQNFPFLFFHNRDNFSSN